MQNYFKSESPEKLVFQSKLENIPGGVTVAVKDLTRKRVGAGTPIGKDANGLYHVVKTAKMQADAASSATEYKVLKGHDFKVGDFLAYGSKGYAITAIDQSNADYDGLTVGTTLGAVSTGEVLFEGDKAAATGVVFKYTPEALVGTTFDVIPNDNHITDAVIRGSVVEANIVVPINAGIKTALSLVRFV